MKRRNQHVVPFYRGWIVRPAGASTFTILSDRKQEAIKFARERAIKTKSDVVIYHRNGKIRTESLSSLLQRIS